MLNLIGRKPGLLLGVDIASSAVKLLELRRIGDGLRLQGSLIQPLPAGAVVERTIVDAAAVGDCLRQALATLRPTTRNAAVAVPASAVICRCIDMDAQLNDEEMEGQVLLEAQQYIPYPLDEVAIDFERRQESVGGSAQVSVQLTACRRDNMASRVKVLQAAGLRVRVVDVESCAMARACSLLPLSAEAMVAVVDIGATLMTLHILQGGRAIYTREQLSGGRQPLQGIARQVERALQLFFSSVGDHDHVSRVDNIILAGGVAVTPGLVALLGERLGVAVTLADPCAQLLLDPGIDTALLREQLPALMTACGLAMRAWR